jgi:hypothetical protein
MSKEPLTSEPVGSQSKSIYKVRDIQVQFKALQMEHKYCNKKHLIGKSLYVIGSLRNVKRVELKGSVLKGQPETEY